MKTMLLPLLFALSISSALAQPLEGPFTVWSVGRDTVLSDVHVTIQGDTTAWVAFVEQTGSTAYNTLQAPFSLTRFASPEPQSLGFARDWAPHIEDVYSDGTTQPFVLVSFVHGLIGSVDNETYLAGYGGVHLVFSGQWINGSEFGGTRFTGGKLSPRLAGGIVLCGAEETRWGVESSISPFVTTFPYNTDIPDHDLHGVGLGNVGVNFFAVCNARDSALLFGPLEYDTHVLMYPLCPDTVLNPDTLTCEEMFSSMGRTWGGRILALGLNYGPDSSQMQLVEISRAGACTIRGLGGRLSLQEDLLAFQGGYGFAIAEFDHGDIRLARIDTNGVQVQPTGVLARTGTGDLQNFGMTINSRGRVVACWTDTNTSNVTEIKLASVGWTAPLEADDRSTILHPSSLVLSAFPNPFNPATTIHFEIVRAGNATLKVFDLLGRDVATLIDSRVEAGAHDLTWDASALSSGVYFARLETGEGVRVQKMVVMK